MHKGDKFFVEHISRLSTLFSSYGKEVGNISDCLATLTIKLEAIINPTAENKLNAVSLPEPTTLSDNLAEYLSTLKTVKSEIENLLKEINGTLESRKLKCDECDGESYIKKPMYDKDSDGIQYIEILCEKCNNGFLPLSKEITDIVTVVFKPFR